MDPNVALEQIRAYAAAMEQPATARNPYDLIHNAVLLREAVADLDEWLSKGGFLPDAWTHAPDPPEPEPPTTEPKPRASELQPGTRIFNSDDHLAAHHLARRISPPEGTGSPGWVVAHVNRSERWESLLYDHEWDNDPKWSVSR